jgi:pimeloyl-ACP methyl ester carboxylesterase
VGAALGALVGCVTASPVSTATPGVPPTATAVSTPAAVATPATTRGPTPPVVPTRLDEALVLADGRELRARCVGEGTPTILLEVGGSGDMTDWAPQFVDALGAATTTCLYSRAGGPGSSAPSTSPPTMPSVTSDAFEVLDLARTKAGVESPYVFVGWSLGGSVALANALARPDHTVGVAIIDTDFPTDFMEACKADGRSLEDCEAEYQQDIDAKFMETEIARAVHPLDVPAALVTAMRLPWCGTSPSATLSTNIGGTTVVAGDCAGLATAIADRQMAKWGEALPEVSQTRLAAEHDTIVLSHARQVADLVLDIVEAGRTSG